MTITLRAGVLNSGIQQNGTEFLTVDSSNNVSLSAALPVLSGGTGVTTKTGTGAVVLGTAPTITGATITVAATAAPAFSAYRNASQSVSNSTYTKVAIDTEEFDTNNNFDSTTNYRFTPTVAGYYQINAGITYSGSVTYAEIRIYKNGSIYKGNYSQLSAGNYAQNTCSIVYCNGSTDYIELYGYMVATTPTFGGGAGSTWFNGAMVRSA